MPDETPDPATPPTAGEAPPEAAPPIHDGLTNEESGKIATVLFDPMVKRMTVLMTSMVTQSNSGDMAYWILIAAMGNVIRDLQWTNAPPIVARQFADLGRVIFRRYSEHLAAYRDQIVRWEAHKLEVPTSAAPFPLLRAWTNADVQAIHDEVDALYLPTPPKEADNARP